MSSDTLIQPIVGEHERVFDEQQVSCAIDSVAKKLNQHLAGQQVVVLCLMNGGLIYTGQLLTRLHFDVEIDYLHISRYNNSTVGDEVNWLGYPRLSLKDRLVLIADDILDEGITLDAAINYCQQQGATQVYSTVLLQKLHERCMPSVKADFVALQVDDRYVFGYGMDYHGKLRHLNAIYAVKPT